jgi:sugar lactone lactonase YvrE
MYVSDLSNSCIRVFSLGGDELYTFGSSGAGPGQFAFPIGVAFDAGGFLYVADAQNHRIQKLDAEGNFILEWGSYGTSEGQFDHPLGVACADGNVFVSDTDNDRIQKFSDTGVFVATWGEWGVGDGQLVNPRMICFRPLETMLVVEEANFRVSEFSKEGEFIENWGELGTDPGEFTSPYGICADAQDHVYVVDSGNSRIQKFAFVSSVGVQAGQCVATRITVMPNPFTESTEILWSGTDRGRAKLDIYDVQGRVVRSLVRDLPGAIRWDGNNASGQTMPNGVYFYRIESGRRAETGKLVRIR